jgi:hypothetical protein
VLTQRSPVEDADARCVVDYALARRATLTAFRHGQVHRDEVCDAQPYGDCFPSGATGRARGRRELRELAGELPDFSVFVVEVCLGCGWNHLVTSFVLGTGEVPAPRRRTKL